MLRPVALGEVASLHIPCVHIHFPILSAWHWRVKVFVLRIFSDSPASGIAKVLEISCGEYLPGVLTIWLS